VAHAREFKALKDRFMLVETALTFAGESLNLFTDSIGLAMTSIQGSTIASTQLNIHFVLKGARLLP
jgi:hypothetical protein